MTSKIALITGATAGIGRATAIRLAQSGFDIIICGRRADKLKEVKDEISGIGVKVLTKILDVRNRADVEAFINLLPAEWKNIDVLVNNAGLAAGLNSLPKVI